MDSRSRRDIAADEPRNAEFMKNDLNVHAGFDLKRMATATEAGKEAALAEGIMIAQEMLSSVRGAVQGVQVSAPFGKYAAAAEVLGFMEDTV